VAVVADGSCPGYSYSVAIVLGGSCPKWQLSWVAVVAVGSWQLSGWLLSGYHVHKNYKDSIKVLFEQGVGVLPRKQTIYSVKNI